eukprot:PRCOL_00001393-RA
MRRRARGRAAPRAAALGCCVVAAALCGGGAPRARADGAYGVPRRDEARLHGAEVDPLGAVDTFERLSPAEQATWRAPTHADAALSSLLRDMSSLRTSSTVEVILVGFGGHHGGSAQLEAADVSTYLEAANLADSAHVLLGDAPDDTRLAARAAPHALPIETAFYFNVRKASDRFADMIERSLGDAYEGAAAAAEASGGRVPPGATLQLPHSAVDDIIAADHHESSLAYAVYVLNPKAMPRNYTYRYGQTGDGGCDGTLYASRERYAWIDLTAGPVHYGPAGVGEGVVLPDTLPRAARLPRAAVGAGAPRHAERLPVDVAALVLRTVRALVAPPMVRRQALVVETEVNLVHVMDHADPKRHAELKRAVASAVEELEPLLLNGQTLALTAVVTDLQRCDACSAAYAAALTSAAPAPGAAATAAAAHGPVTLDSKQLHWDMRAMRHSVLAAAIGERKVVATFGPSVADAERAPAGLDEHGGGGIKQRRVVPVYVFDMAHMTDSLLLDGGIAASAAADQVVASRSRSDPAVSQSECGGVAAVIDPNDLPRDILGALLEALYGVPRAGAGWSGSDSETRGGELRYDALWTVVRAHLRTLRPPAGTCWLGRRSLTLCFRVLAWHAVRICFAGALAAGPAGIGNHAAILRGRPCDSPRATLSHRRTCPRCTLRAEPLRRVRRRACDALASRP